MAALAALGLPIVRRLLSGQYATHAWVEAKLRPLADKAEINGGRIRDIDADHRVLKAEFSHMPTIEHLDELKERMAELSQISAVQHAENKSELQNMLRALEKLSEDLERRER